MSQAARRQSGLGGSPPESPAPAAAEASTPPAGTAAQVGKRKYPPKVSFYQDPDDTARLRAAYLNTIAREGTRSLSDFIGRAVMTEVERLERIYNGGQPFPVVGAREVPQGRPIGE